MKFCRWGTSKVSRDNLIKKFLEQEDKYQHMQRQQYYTDNRTYTSTTGPDRPYTQNELALMQQQQQQLQQAEKVTLSYRPMAEQVRCARCKWKSPDGCWECSGTGIDPIPFAEVQSGERETGTTSPADISNDKFNTQMADLLKHVDRQSIRKLGSDF